MVDVFVKDTTGLVSWSWNSICWITQTFGIMGKFRTSPGWKWRVCRFGTTQCQFTPENSLKPIDSSCVVAYNVSYASFNTILHLYIWERKCMLFLFSFLSFPCFVLKFFKLKQQLQQKKRSGILVGNQEKLHSQHQVLICIMHTHTIILSFKVFCASWFLIPNPHFPF